MREPITEGSFCEHRTRTGPGVKALYSARERDLWGLAHIARARERISIV